MCDIWFLNFYGFTFDMNDRKIKFCYCINIYQQKKKIEKLTFTYDAHSSSAPNIIFTYKK